MAFKTFVDAVALPASDLNTYLMKQAVIVCTSGTRPASPAEGETIYETDTDKLLIYTTATTLWQPPWNMPWGQVGYAEVTANQSGITTTTDLTSLSVTWTAVANRRYLYTAQIRMQSNTANDLFAFEVTDAAPITKFQFLGQTHVSTGFDLTYSLDFRESGVASGSTTRKLRAGRAGGSAGTFQMSAAASAPAAPAFLLVEDIGPNGSPA